MLTIRALELLERDGYVLVPAKLESIENSDIVELATHISLPISLNDGKARSNGRPFWPAIYD